MSEKRLTLTLIAAVARNGVIGADNRLIWWLPTDLRRFKALTLGKPLVMGRKTFESIGKPLPGRETIVITRDNAFAAPGARVAHEIDDALALAATRAEAMGVSDILVAGGGEIYAQTIGRADRLAITEVDISPAGDSFFPAIDPAIWREARREQGVRGSTDAFEFLFTDYLRRD